VVPRLQLSPNVDAPRQARDFVAEQGQGLPECAVDDARLLVSELVTNALRHGRPDITVQVELNPPLIEVSVHDEGTALPPADPPPALPTALSGRGLNLVDRIASCWGITRTESPRGKAVWFRLEPAPG
jgi:anti-sigma regulatory factor (Ser/Thr protein kinase)